MKRALLHIGTEKTGSTSIQKFLYANRRRLAQAGYLYPHSAGLMSNTRLVVYAKDEPEADLVPRGLDATDADALADWKTRFVVEHCAEVLPFLGRRGDATLVYSSEHLQSRLTTREEIERVARLMRALVDEVRIVVWLRRQDRFALSAHGTAVRAGNPNPFSFERIGGTGPYYDYRRLLENWAAAFGEEALTVRVFERARLAKGDVVEDFREHADVGRGLRGLVRPEPENRALSWSAQATLRAFNAGRFDETRVSGHDRAALHRFLLDAVEAVEDPNGSWRPARAEAVAFQRRFDEANAEIAARWLGGQGFDSSFDEYPEHPAPPPAEAEAEARLEHLIDAWLARPAAANA